MAKMIRILPRFVFILALFGCPAIVVADYSPNTELKGDAQAQRLLEKRLELKEQQERLTAEGDRLYTESTATREPTFLQENGWNLLMLSFLALVIIRLLIYRRQRTSGPAPVIIPNQLFMNGQTIEEPSTRSHRSSLWSFLSGKSSHRRHSRSSRHRHRRRSR